MNDVIHSVLTVVGSVTLDSGTSGSTDSILINGVEILSGAVAFDTSLGQTAINVAANITAFASVPNYTAIAVGNAINITGGQDGFLVVSTATGIVTTDVDLSGGQYDLSSYDYTQIYAAVAATPIINGVAVAMIAGGSIPILVKSISSTANVYALGRKKLIIPQYLNG